MLIIQYRIAENTGLMEFILFVGAWNTTLGLPKKSPKTALPNLQGQVNRDCTPKEKEK